MNSNQFFNIFTHSLHKNAAAGQSHARSNNHINDFFTSHSESIHYVRNPFSFGINNHSFYPTLNSASNIQDYFHSYYNSNPHYNSNPQNIFYFPRQFTSYNTFNSMHNRIPQNTFYSTRQSTSYNQFNSDNNFTSPNHFTQQPRLNTNRRTEIHRNVDSILRLILDRYVANLVENLNDTPSSKNTTKPSTKPKQNSEKFYQKNTQRTSKNSKPKDRYRRTSPDFHKAQFFQQYAPKKTKEQHFINNFDLQHADENQLTKANNILQSEQTHTDNSENLANRKNLALKILGLENNSKNKITKKEVAKTFRDLSKKYHPDKGGDQEKFALLNNAKGVLNELIETDQL